MTRTKLYLSITLNVIVTLEFLSKTTTTTNSKNHGKIEADRIETDKYIDAGDIYFQN
jgi:hypothetical protein